MKRKNKKRKIARYPKYYQRIMEPVLVERWETYLNRLRILKKDLLKLGPIPTKEIQLIKTTNYFVKFIDLLTDFHDKGMLECATEKKAQAVYDFNDMLVTLVAREESICYLNKSENGQRITANNLYLGSFVPVTEKDNLKNIEIKQIDGIKVKVEVEYTPLSEWINKRAIAKDGSPARISQKTLSRFLDKRKSMLLEIIDEILK